MLRARCSGVVVTKGDGGSAGADNKLTTDGVIYPKYAAFAEAQTGNSPTQLWGLEIDHTQTVIVESAKFHEICSAAALQGQ